MKFVFSILTAFWAGFATPSLLPAEDHAGVTRAAPGERANASRADGPVACRVPTCAGSSPIVFVHGLWATRPSSGGARRSRGSRPIPRLTDPSSSGRSARLNGEPYPIFGLPPPEGPRRGQPAAQPGQDRPVLDRMALVGHSMGGLLCKMVAVDPATSALASGERPFLRRG